MSTQLVLQAVAICLGFGVGKLTWGFVHTKTRFIIVDIVLPSAALLVYLFADLTRASWVLWAALFLELFLGYVEYMLYEIFSYKYVFRPWIRLLMTILVIGCAILGLVSVYFIPAVAAFHATLRLTLRVDDPADEPRE